jgi:hypothetical protein
MTMPPILGISEEKKFGIVGMKGGRRCSVMIKCDKIIVEARR